MCRILVVDDVWAEREGICGLIEKLGLGMEIKQAANGKAALEYMAKGNVADILLTDIEMPYMDGIELSGKARQMYPGIKSLILSAHDEFDYARRAISASVSGYLLKPIQVDEFNILLYKTYQDWRRERADDIENDMESGEDVARAEDEAQPCRNIIRLVLSIIEQEYMEDIGLDYIAGRVFLTPSYLSTLFKKEMGVSLIRYINEHRLQKARQMLNETNIRISRISGEVGFKTLPYFYTVFKNRFGITPAEYREGAAALN